MYYLILLFIFCKYYRAPYSLFLDIMRIYTWLEINVYNRILNYYRQGNKIIVKNVTQFCIDDDPITFHYLPYNIRGSVLEFSNFNQYENEFVCITLEYNNEKYYKFLTHENNIDLNQILFEEKVENYTLACIVNYLDELKDYDITKILNRILYLNREVRLFHLKLFIIKNFTNKTLITNTEECKINIITYECENINASEGMFFIQDCKLIFID